MKRHKPFFLMDVHETEEHRAMASLKSSTLNSLSIRKVVPPSDQSLNNYARVI